MIALQLKMITNKVLGQTTTMNLFRNYSRTLIPSMFWDDPFRRHRQLVWQFWNAPDPFDALSPIQKFRRYRIPSKSHWVGGDGIVMARERVDGFQFSVDVKQFSPSEISVKVVDNSILVEAKHEKRIENGKIYTIRHITKRYDLPDGFNVKDIVSTLSSDGILTVTVPPSHMSQIDTQNIRNIHIQHTRVQARDSGQIKGPEPNQNQAMKNEPKEK